MRDLLFDISKRRLVANTIDMNSTILDKGMHDIGAELVHRGKVRDVYKLPNGQLAMIATNRISAFDVVLPREIPYKGEILNRLSKYMLEATRDIVPNWFEAMPDPQVMIGKVGTPIKVEMVVREYLTGSWWRKYSADERSIGGKYLPAGMKKFDKFGPHGPILTPTTKADAGHDEDISPGEIIDRNLCTLQRWQMMCEFSFKLFCEGTRIARERGLILCDTKYEFGLTADGQVILIDEVNTPDSSRYYYAEGFDEIVAAGGEPKELSKEFVRQWLLAQPGFDKNRPKETMRDEWFTDEWAQGVSNRYIELYEAIMGEKFAPIPVPVTIGSEARVISVIQGYMQSERV